MSQYNGFVFKTNLEAQWAAFFDLIGWDWKTNIAPVANLSIDFLVSFSCGHSECSGSHELYVCVLPMNKIENIDGHPAFKLMYNSSLDHADNGAVFGNHPKATQFEIMHGSGGGFYALYDWVDQDVNRLWEIAATKIRVS